MEGRRVGAGERVPEIHNRGAEVPKADQLFHSNHKDHVHMDHSPEEVPTDYEFSEAEHMEQKMHSFTILL